MQIRARHSNWAAEVQGGVNILLRRFLKRSGLIRNIPERGTTWVAENRTLGIRQMLWPSLETASRIADIANVLFIGSLAICVAAAILIAWMANVKEAHWTVEREQAEARAAVLKKDTLRLETEAETARANVANANARALEAQLALEAFRAPRVIGKGDKARLVSALSLFSGTKAAIYVVGEGMEQNGLGTSIHELLAEAYWQVLTWTWFGAGPASGVVVTYKAGSDQHIIDICGALVTAFNSAQIKATKMVWPGDWEHFSGFLNGPSVPSPVEAPIRIIIGTKPL